MLDEVIVLNKEQLKNKSLLEKLTYRLNQRTQFLNNKYNRLGYRKCVSDYSENEDIHNDKISIYLFLLTIYFEKVSRKHVKKMNFYLSDYDFATASDNESRGELIDQVLQFMNKKGLKTKLLVEPFEHCDTLFNYKITIETL